MSKLRFSVGLIKPVKRLVVRRQILATDRAWREAIFGLGGTQKRIGGARIGLVGAQPLAVIAELPEEVDQDAPHWSIETDAGLWAFIGPGAVYNDAGFGPANLGITLETLQSIVRFDLPMDELQEGLRRTLQKRGEPPEETLQ